MVYTGTDGIKSSATTAKALANASPFLANGVIYKGEKIDKVVRVDVRTGEIIDEFGVADKFSPYVTGNESIIVLGRTGRNDFVLVNECVCVNAH